MADIVHSNAPVPISQIIPSGSANERSASVHSDFGDSSPFPHSSSVLQNNGLGGGGGGGGGSTATPTNFSGSPVFVGLVAFGTTIAVVCGVFGYMWLRKKKTNTNIAKKQRLSARVSPNDGGTESGVRAKSDSSTSSSPRVSRTSFASLSSNRSSTTSTRKIDFEKRQHSSPVDNIHNGNIHSIASALNRISNVSTSDSGFSELNMDDNDSRLSWKSNVNCLIPYENDASIVTIQKLTTTVTDTVIVDMQHQHKLAPPPRNTDPVSCIDGRSSPPHPLVSAPPPSPLNDTQQPTAILKSTTISSSIRTPPSNFADDTIARPPSLQIPPPPSFPPPAIPVPQKFQVKLTASNGEHVQDARESLVGAFTALSGKIKMIDQIKKTIKTDGSPPTVSEKKKNVSFHPLAAEIIAEKLAKDEGEFDASTVENQVTPAAEIKTELRQGYDMEEY